MSDSNGLSRFLFPIWLTIGMTYLVHIFLADYFCAGRKRKNMTCKKTKVKIPDFSECQISSVSASFSLGIWKLEEYAN